MIPWLSFTTPQNAYEWAKKNAHRFRLVRGGGSRWLIITRERHLFRAAIGAYR